MADTATAAPTDAPDLKRKRDEETPDESAALTPASPPKKVVVDAGCDDDDTQPEQDREGLWRSYYGTMRDGSLEALFFAPHSKIAEASGKTVYFGDKLGKHSDVTVKFDELDVTLVTDDPALIAAMHILFDEEFGYNPLDYIGTAEDDGEVDADDDIEDGVVVE